MKSSVKKTHMWDICKRCLIRELRSGNRKINSLVNRWSKDLGQTHRRGQTAGKSACEHSPQCASWESQESSALQACVEGHCSPTTWRGRGSEAPDSGLGGRRPPSRLRTGLLSNPGTPRAGEDPLEQHQQSAAGHAQVLVWRAAKRLPLPNSHALRCHVISSNLGWLFPTSCLQHWVWYCFFCLINFLLSSISLLQWQWSLYQTSLFFQFSLVQCSRSVVRLHTCEPESTP